MNSFSICFSLVALAFTIASCNGDKYQPKCQDKKVSDEDYDEAEGLLIWFCGYDSKIRSEGCYAMELYNYMQPVTSGFLNFIDMRSKLCDGTELKNDNKEVSKVSCDIADKVQKDEGVWKIIKKLDPNNKCKTVS